MCPVQCVTYVSGRSRVQSREILTSSLAYSQTPRQNKVPPESNEVMQAVLENDHRFPIIILGFALVLPSIYPQSKISDRESQNGNSD